jgi:hypothetical protein
MYEVVCVYEHCVGVRVCGHAVSLNSCISSCAEQAENDHVRGDNGFICSSIAPREVLVVPRVIAPPWKTSPLLR